MIIDHHIMQISEVLVIPNSTFSFTAAMLNRNRNAIFYRPSLKLKDFFVFDPWDAPIYQREYFYSWRFIRHLGVKGILQGCFFIIKCVLSGKGVFG
jgi:hypothetical protein